MSADAVPETAVARLGAGQVRAHVDKPFSLEESDDRDRDCGHAERAVGPRPSPSRKSPAL